MDVISARDDAVQSNRKQPRRHGVAPMSGDHLLFLLRRSCKVSSRNAIKSSTNPPLTANPVAALMMGIIPPRQTLALDVQASNLYPRRFR